MPLDCAAFAMAFSPSGLIIFARPDGQTKSGSFTGTPRIVLDVSTCATSRITRGRNHILLIIDWFMSRVQQSVEAVE